MVAHQLGYKGSPSALASQVHVTSNDQVGVLQISANDPTGAEAVRLVDAFDRQLIAYLNNQIAASYGRQQSAAHAQLQAVRSQIATLQAKARTALVQAELTALQSQYRTDAASYAQLQGSPPRPTLPSSNSPWPSPAPR